MGLRASNAWVRMRTQNAQNTAAYTGNLHFTMKKMMEQREREIHKYRYILRDDRNAAQRKQDEENKRRKKKIVDTRSGAEPRQIYHRWNNI